MILPNQLVSYFQVIWIQIAWLIAICTNIIINDKLTLIRYNLSFNFRQPPIEVFSSMTFHLVVILWCPSAGLKHVRLLRTNFNLYPCVQQYSLLSHVRMVFVVIFCLIFPVLQATLDKMFTNFHFLLWGSRWRNWYSCWNISEYIFHHFCDCVILQIFCGLGDGRF